MSDKATCPACNSHTSKIHQRFEDGLPCPYCGLPAEVAAMVWEARDRHADEALTERLLAAEKRLAEVEHENGHLRAQLDGIRRELDRKPTSLADRWD